MTAMPGEQEIGSWLADYVGELLARPAAEVDRDGTFDSFGLDSATAIGITGELEEWLGIRIDPQAAEDYPTIRLLSRHLAARVAAEDMAV
jgi:acyl carrier protein